MQTQTEEHEFQGSDRYTVRRCLGGGTLGLVFEGYDRLRKTEVALKTLRAYTPQSLYRLKQEFRSLADLSHPNLVTLYELVGGDGQDWFIAMEMIRGVDFYRHVRGEDAPNPLSSATWVSRKVEDLGSDEEANIPLHQPDARMCDDIGRLRRAIVQVISGAGALHEAGKQHRDIKPSNVLVTSEGRVVLLDFGLVYDGDRAQSELSRIDTVAGTVAYMAPEQAAGAPPAAHSDMYSIGVLLFQGLTGRLPFDGSLVQILQQMQAKEAPRPSDLVDGVPEDLDDLTAALLARDPRRRPSAMEALLRLGEDPSLLAVQARVRGSASDQIEGREQERRFLDAAWQTAKKGRLTVAVIRGETGMGKTAVAYHFLRTLRASEDVTILRGRCYEREQVPYKAFDSLIDGLRRRLKRLPREEVDMLLPPDAWLLARIFPVIAELVTEQEPTDRDALTVDPAELRLRAFHAMRELLRNIARRRPVVVAIDDVQWGDADSARLLAGWLKSLTRSRVLILLAWRSEDEAGSPFLQHLLNDPIWVRSEVRQLELGPLSPAVATGVARGLLGDRHPNPIEAAVWIAEESGGNPHLLAELAAALRTSAELGADDSQRSLTLDQLVRERMEQLEEEARRLLAFVAIAGRPLPLRVLARAAELDDGTGPKHISLLRTQRFVRTNESPLGLLIELYHDRVGAAVRETATPEKQAMRHAKLAQAMEAEAWDDPEALMGHYLNAGRQKRAAELAIQAARNAVETLAFDQAAELYRTALMLGSWDPDAAEDIRRKLAESLTYAGRGPQAADVYLELAQGASSDEAQQLRRKAAEQLLASGYYERGLDLLNTVLHDVALQMPESKRALWVGIAGHHLCLWWRGLRFTDTPESQCDSQMLQKIDTAWFSALALSLVDPTRGAWFHGRNLLHSLEVGEPYRVLRAFCMELTLRAARGNYDWKAWSDLLMRCKALANSLGRAQAAALVHLGEGMGAYLDGRFNTAQRLLHQSEKVYVELVPGTTFEVSVARLFALRAQMYSGQLKLAAEQHQRVLADAEMRGDRLLQMNLHGDMFVLVHLAADDSDQARAALASAADAGGKALGTYQMSFTTRGYVSLALYEGHFRRAWREVQVRSEAIAEAGVEYTEIARIFLYDTKVHAALAAGNPGEARKLTRLLRKSKHRLAEPFLVLFDAGHALWSGNRDQAAELFGLAAKAFDKVEMQLYAHIARRRQGQLISGREGTLLVQAADGWLANEGVRDVARFSAALVPVPEYVEAVERRGP